MPAPRICLLTISLAMILSAAPSSAAVINVPADQPTIQAGIDFAAEGDTVLVAPGIYEETITFQSKVVGSWFLTTGDTSYISQTIIDPLPVGDSYLDISYGVRFYGDFPNTVLTGFTIQGASIGIACYGASPELKNLIIRNIAVIGGGVGIYSSGSNLAVKNIVYIIAPEPRLLMGS